MARVLVVDETAKVRRALLRHLSDEGHEAVGRGNPRAALKHLRDRDYDVVVTDFATPPLIGLDLLTAIRSVRPAIKVVLMATKPSFEAATEAIRAGAFDFLVKPVTRAAICRVVGSASKIKALEDENRDYREHLEDLVKERTQRLRGYSDSLRLVAARTRRFAQCRNVSELGIRILRLLSESLGAQGGSFYIVADGALDLVHALDPGHQPRRIPLPPARGSVTEKVLSKGESLVVANIADPDLDLRPSGWDGYREGSFLAMPCFSSSGTIRGVIALHNKKAPPFTEQDLEIGRIIVMHGAEALRNIELTRRLTESEGKYKAISEQSLTGILIQRGGRLNYVNPRLVSLLGYDENETSTLIDQPVGRFIHPADRSRFEGYIQRRIRGEEPPKPSELRLLTKSGADVWVEVLVSTIEGQEPPALLVHLINVTDRKEAEEEKAQLEDQLRQSQKMEAIGRLAGGVAHDFNNLLTAIQGYSEMMLLGLPANAPLRGDMLQIKRAADRAAALTQQLLAFSRKQNIEPRLVDLNQQLREARDMLGRVIGEDVRLTLNLCPREAPIHADPHQIDQVLLNLVANARDAMPNGGRIEIMTRMVKRKGRDPSLPPVDLGDDFVRLTLTDDGEGMDESTRKRIFEPFFTTKEKGKGTGLGLATVYGIVSQNRGVITVKSAPGKGARFDVVFPAARGKVSPEAAAKAPMRTGRGTILLVEDEEMVRSLARKVLASTGYRVLEASSGGDALVISEKCRADIELLLTDVVMPNMNGKELYHRLRARRPALRVLYMSGYTEDVIAHHGIVEEGTPFLQKPFSIDALSRKVADVMSRDAASL
jgi:PAS domain S-box-containing protein